MTQLFWYVIVDSDCTRTVHVDEVSQVIHDTLHDPRGLIKLGHEFHQVPVNVGRVIRAKRVWRSSDVVCVEYRVSSEKTIRSECGFGGLNCAKTQFTDRQVLLHVDLWRKGSVDCRLDLDDYRRYVVNHETLHILGRDHVEWPRDPNEPCPVMFQQTIAKGRCVETPWKI